MKLLSFFFRWNGTLKVDPGYKSFMSEWWKISKISIPDITDRVNKKETMYVGSIIAK